VRAERGDAEEEPIDAKRAEIHAQVAEYAGQFQGVRVTAAVYATGQLVSGFEHDTVGVDAMELNAAAPRGGAADRAEVDDGAAVLHVDAGSICRLDQAAVHHRPGPAHLDAVCAIAGHRDLSGIVDVAATADDDSRPSGAGRRDQTAIGQV